MDEVVSDLQKRVAVLEKTVADISDATKVEKKVLQVVIEPEGDVVKVRRKVLMTTATEQKEVWEDATDEIDDKVVAQILPVQQDITLDPKPITTDPQTEGGATNGVQS